MSKEQNRQTGHEAKNVKTAQQDAQNCKNQSNAQNKKPEQTQSKKDSQTQF